MTDNRYLYFVYDIIKEKNTYQGGRELCPFCHREELTDIIDEQDGIILLKNKFPTLENTFQSVIIETGECDANIATYSAAHMRRLMTFGIDHWLAMEASGEFKSVVFFKNHGPLSGGTIDHSHMQIVGLTEIDYRLNLRNDVFEGIEIYREGTNYLNISTKPNACSTEFNIVMNERDDAFMADQIQVIVKYLLSQWNSFNLFFYQWSGAIICKIAPRYVVSPFLIGYSIPQTSNRVKDIALEIKKMYEEAAK